MLALVDNYDSFTYNLAQYFSELGADVRVFRNDQISLNELIALQPDYLVISPGPGEPLKDGGISPEALKYFAGKIPVLGVCLGHQCLAAMYGGKVDRAPRLMHGKTSLVNHNGQGIFKNIPTPFEAMRYHSLIVYEPIPAELDIIAQTAEGEIMGLKHKQHPTYGVQFHPESILTEHGKQILKNFLDIKPVQPTTAELASGFLVDSARAKDALIQVNQVLLKSGEGWLHFSKPHQIISALRISDVRAALREVEARVNERGWYAAGFVSYNAAPAFDSALRALSSNDFPLLWFGLYDKPRELEHIEVEEISPALNWQPEVSREAYCSAIDAVKEYIAQGKTYQVNFTTRLRARFDSSAWDLFARITRGQNRYAAYVDTGRYVVCSASPELFFTLSGETISSRPMKGTTRRGRATREDALQAEWLRRSEKNRAENVMIVDMIRNDFGRIAETGSVQVPALFTIEKYPTLLQMTSTVRAQTRRSVSEMFDALFPCASITGAPKVSAMNIIAELESSPRNIYTGSVGFIAPNREAQFNVAIRTVLIDREMKTAEYGAGGGVVWDSTSAGEYDEAILKARVLTAESPQFDLFETLRWNLEEGFFLLDEHLARLEDSAAYFDFPFSRKNVEEYLQSVAKHFDAPQRVRLALDPRGGLRHQIFVMPRPRAALRAHLAVEPIDSMNPFYFHKTTRREIYPTPQSGYDDALLYNENGELTEFTMGNLVVKMDGKLYTPPAECGLLAGTFRARLLFEEKIAERVLLKHDLARCEKIFFINSVRGFEEAVIL